MTVFADGVDRVRPTVIFLGKGLRAKEKQSYDRRVKVMYQKKAWCDEDIMKECISTEWISGKFLIADVHRVQQTNNLKELLKKHINCLANVPLGCTSHVQVVDVLINKPFKDEVRSLFEDHLDKNLDQYVDGKINVSQRRVLMRK